MLNDARSDVVAAVDRVLDDGTFEFEDVTGDGGGLSR